MAFRQIKSPALANQAVVNTKLDTSAITGQLAAASGDLTDVIMMYSASGNSLKKLTLVNLISSFDTANLAEGNNLYFTDARAKAAVASDIAAAVLAEKNRAELAEGTLTTNLGAEITRAGLAEDANTTAINNEIARATGAENDLDADYKLADAGLQTQINNILSNTDPAALDSLAEIVNAYQSADNVFTAAVAANGTAIAAEETRAITAEGILTTSFNNVQAEVNTIEAGAGLGADGTYTADATTNYLTAAASLKDADGKLDAQIKIVADALAAEIGTTNGEISALQTADTTLQSNINGVAADLVTEKNRAEAAELANANAIQDEIDARVLAVDNEESARVSADTAIQSELNASQTGAGLAANGNYVAPTTSNYHDTATSLANADMKLDGAIKANADAIAQEVTDRGTAVSGEATARTTADNALDTRATTLESEMDSAEGRLDALEAESGTSSGGFDTTATTTVGAINEIHGEVDVLEGRISTNEDDIADNATAISNILSNTDAAALDSLTEVVAAFQSADGTLSGYISANTTAIGIEQGARSSADTTLQGNIDSEAGTRGTADTTLQNNINAEATTRGDADSAATSDRAAIRSEFATADGDIQSELNTSQTGAGLNADGTYAADATTNYLSAAVSLKDADKKLDAQVKANADALAAEISTTNTEISNLESRMGDEETASGDATTDRAAIRSEFAAADSTLQDNIDDVQSELDASQTGAGLGADGVYTPNASSNYLTAATSLKDADNKLDAQAKVNADAIAQEVTDRTNDVSAEQTRAEGAESTLQTNIDNEETRAMGVESGLDSRLSTAEGTISTHTGSIATEIADRIAADGVIQSELNLTQTGAGLDATGTYTADVTTNYLTAATSLKDADKKLDAQVKLVDGRVDAILNGSAESLDTLIEVVEAFEAADSTINGAISTLSGAAATARGVIQSELNTTQTGAGLGTDGTYAADLTTTHIATATSLKDADKKLDSAIVAEAAARDAEDLNLQAQINTLSGTSSGSFNNVQAELDATQTGAGLDANGDYTASGSANYVATATSLKDADNKLDVALKAVDAAYKAADTALDTAYKAADTTIRTDFAAADLLIQNELNTSQSGAGLNTDGTYAANAASTYLTAAVSLKDADNKLDVQAKANADAIVQEVSDRQSAVTAEATARGNADTTLQNNIDAEETARIAADNTLSGNFNNVQAELDTTQTGAGLGTTGAYAADATTNYLTTATSLKDADKKLDTAVKAEQTRALAAESANETAIGTEQTRAEAEELRIEGLVSAEFTRATGVEGVHAGLIQDNADELAQEILDRAAADTNLQGQIDFITSNTDAAALDSLTEVVAAFQGADSSVGVLVADNTTAIAETQAELDVTQTGAGLGANGTYSADATTTYLTAASSLKDADKKLDAALELADSTIRTDFAAADTTIRTDFAAADALKLNLTGGTMSGDVAMGGNMVSGLGTATNPNDAVSKAVMDAALIAQNINGFDTDELTEGSTNLYFTEARARAAVSASGDLNYNVSTGEFSVDTSKSFLDLTDYVGSETDYSAIPNYVVQVDETGTGLELVDPAELNFATMRRQTIDGDGNQVTFALNFVTTQTDAMVFVGGVIQDPVSHYTLDSSAQTITFVTAIPLDTQVVVVSHPVASVPYIETGTVTKDKLASDVKAYTQQSAVSATTGGSVVDTFDGTAFRSGKYIIQVDDGAGAYETREALVVHDGTSAYITEFAIVYTGAGLLGDASVQMNGSDVELVYTANTAGTTVKVISTYIDV